MWVVFRATIDTPLVARARWNGRIPHTRDTSSERPFSLPYFSYENATNQPRR